MLNVPESVKALWMADENPQIRRNLRVQFPNGELPDVNGDQIVAGSFKFVETIMSHSTFKYGSVEAPTIEFMTMGVGNMLGMTIFCRMEIETTTLTSAQIAEIQAGTWDGELVLEADSDIGYGFYAVPLGFFVVDQCPRDHGLMTRRRVRAYGFTAGSDEAEIYSFDRWRFQNWYLHEKMTINVTHWLYATMGILARNASISTRTGSFGDGGRTAFREVYYYSGAADENTGITITLQLWYTSTKGGVSGGGYTSDVFSLDNVKYDDSDLDAWFDSISEDSVGSAIPSEVLTEARAAIDALTAVMQKRKDEYYGINYGYHLNENGSLSEAWYNISPDDVGRRFYVPYRVLYDHSGLLEDYVHESIVRIPAYFSASVIKRDISTGTSETKDFVMNFWQGLSHYEAPTITRYLVGGGTFIFLESNTTEEYAATTYYSFSGKFPLAKTMNSEMEISGLFCRQGRDGEFETVKLNNTNPFTYAVGSYQECWYDEYDLSPVGTIIFSYTDENKGAQQATYSFGEGKSIYDISGNTILEANAYSVSQGTGWLTRFFIPNIDDLNFTPVELTGKAFPWIEAGDAIEIITEDGEVVESYVLERTMSGLMALTDSIYSSGGDLAEVEIDV